MRYRSVCRGCLVALLAVVGAIAIAGGQTGGPSGDPADRAPVSFPLPEGGFFVNLPADWESNPKLAEDNATVGFLHPGGMEVGETIPMWILVERRLFDTEQSFDSLLRECLEEGKAHGFTAEDSTTVKTADGRTIINYRFNPGEDGEERGLAFMETADGAILLRQHADDTEIWGKYADAINAILGSARFLAKQEN